MKNRDSNPAHPCECAQATWTRKTRSEYPSPDASAATLREILIAAGYDLDDRDLEIETVEDADDANA